LSDVTFFRLPTMMKKIYIESKPGVLAGTPVVVGTRIPISRLLYLLSQGYTIGGIKEEYPQLTKRTIIGVIETIAEEAEKGKFYQPIP